LPNSTAYFYRNGIQNTKVDQRTITGITGHRHLALIWTSSRRLMGE